MSETSFKMTNLFQEIKDGPEFCLKEIQTGITFSSALEMKNFLKLKSIFSPIIGRKKKTKFTTHQ